MEQAGQQRWRGDITGLRAVAILPVLLFHFGTPGFGGGFFGVDVFFVISGFLITGIVAREGADFSYLEFVTRRMRRILPAFYVMAAAVSVIALVILTPQNLERYGRALAAAAGFVSNILAAKETRYFDPAVIQRPLVHTWSLAIEEQFYLFFPLLLAWLSRRRWSSPPVVWALFAASLLGAIALGGGKGGYYSTPWRAWELMLGGLIALNCIPPIPDRLKTAASVLGLAMVAASVVFLDSKARTPGIATLLPCVGAALLIHAGSGSGSVVGRGLGIRPLRAIGAISYSLYLWHWPVIVFFRYLMLREAKPLEAFGLLMLTFALAAATFWLVERPARGLKRTTVFWLSGAATASALVLGGAMAVTHGLPGRLPASLSPVAAEADNGGACFLQPGQKGQAWARAGCTRGPAGAPEVMVWGDSYAAHYVPGLVGLGTTAGFRIVEAAYSSCAPLLGYTTHEKGDCRGFTEAVKRSIGDHPPKVAILAAHWDYEVANSDLNGSADALARTLGGTIQTLKALGVKKVLVVGETPDYPLDVPQMALGLSLRRARLAAPTITRFSYERTLEASAKSAGAEFFEPGALVCRAGICRLADDQSRLLQWDNGHLSLVGSDFFARAMAPKLAPLLAQ